MVGVPGSGKSTIIEKLKKKYPNTDVVCPDEYRKALGGTYNHFDNDSLIWNNLCPTDIRASLSNGRNVIFDATNVGVKRRKTVLKWVDTLDVDTMAVVVQVSIETALRQNKLREKDKIVPDGVIQQMFANFVYPSKSEGFDVIVKSSSI